MWGFTACQALVLRARSIDLPASLHAFTPRLSSARYVLLLMFLCTKYSRSPPYLPGTATHNQDRVVNKRRTLQLGKVSIFYVGWCLVSRATEKNEAECLGGDECSRGGVLLRGRHVSRAQSKREGVSLGTPGCAHRGGEPRGG